MIKWIGTIGGILGAVLVAANNGMQFAGYIAFLIGAVSWLYASIKARDNAAIIQWAFFSVVNLFGLFNYA